MNKPSPYIAFLRGINVGGHHKVPMAALRSEFERLGCSHVSTLLNSGNVIFDADINDESAWEQTLAEHLENVFQFPIPVLIRRVDILQSLIEQDPFKTIDVTSDTRLYVSFLKQKTDIDLPLPWQTEDGCFQIIGIFDRTICSVLDLAVTQTTKGMDVLEQMFGKGLTTRNWNTIIRLVQKAEDK